MNFFTRSTTLFSFALTLSLAATSTFAVTVKYELKNLQSNNGWIHYPDLDFSNATSAILTVEKRDPYSEPQIKSLDITFPNAAKLSAKDFKQVNVDGSGHRAVVDDAWIYRQVIVDIHGINFYDPQSHLTIDVAVSEKQGFINPENQERGEHILLAHGQLKDITTSKIVDTGSAVVNGKRANLSLKNRLAISPSGAGSFAIDVLWMGKGENTIYVDSGFTPNYFDFVTPIALILEDLTSPEGPMIKVTAKDYNGNQIEGQPLRLKALLEQAYGPQP